MDKRLVKLGKFLSLVLRHKPEELSLQLDSSGWVSVEALLEACRRRKIGIDKDTLEEIVFTNNKRRYSFSEDGLYIRANQGHSLSVDLGLEPVRPPDELLHGTAGRFIESIRQKGLLKGQRHHVHLTTSEATARSVGNRYGKPVLLRLLAADMHIAGFRFFMTANEVWLVEHVPPAYILFPD